MKSTLKPLFHEKTLRQAIAAFTFPDDMDARHAEVLHWARALRSGTLDVFTEVSLHGDFLRGFFVPVLGYSTVVGGDGKAWTLHPEKTIADGGGKADGALGWFTRSRTPGEKVKLDGQIVAAIELKGAKTGLDRLTAGGKETPVQQGWRYANSTVGCKWVVVSNYARTRLYSVDRSNAFGEEFLLEDLQDRYEFERFYYLLCAGNLLPDPSAPHAPTVLDRLLQESDDIGEKITRDLYDEYQGIRKSLVNHLWATRPMDLDRPTLLARAQTILDRMLFVAFCEDQGLLPPNTTQKACDFSDPYNPATIWDRYKAVFSSVDQGNDKLCIKGYNGGLFHPDPLIDDVLTVPDEICREMARIATRYDFETEVPVHVLGHIFEKSVSDLEELRAIAIDEEYDRNKGVRKTQGIYYTPPFITQYIVEVALGGKLRREEEALRARFEIESIPTHHTKRRARAELGFWRAYRDDVLKKTRVVDPACGSGAFLIAAFDFLQVEYQRVNEALADLEDDQYTLEHLNNTILTRNLYGVDLSAESVEITKLSLWLKTAEKNKQLTFLDDNIQQGNSLIDDKADHPDAFDWRARFPEVFTDGGFDVVLGNPPYVRQELLGPYKAAFKRRFESFDAVADLYTYFYELGVDILKPGGLMSYIVTNKWMRSGYGEALRKFFATHTVFEQIIDFGHAPVFEDADVFPCIVSVRKTLNTSEPGDGKDVVRVCKVAPKALATINLSQHEQQHGYNVPWTRFGAQAWSLEPREATALLAKLRKSGIPLSEFAGTKPYYGVKTGLNKAFVVDDATAHALRNEDPRSDEILRPFLRGKDIRRWRAQPKKKEWLILARRGIDLSDYPAIERHLCQFREQLEPRPRDWNVSTRGKWPGRKPGPYPWYELQDAVDYHELFVKPKIITQDLATYPWFCLDESGSYPVNTCYVWPTDDLYVLGWMNSPLAWWLMHRSLQHAIGDTLRMFREQVEVLPVAEPSGAIRTRVEEAVAELLAITDRRRAGSDNLVHWLVDIFGVRKPGPRLQDAASLREDQFVKGVASRCGSRRQLVPGDVGRLIAAYNETVAPLRADRIRSQELERLVSDSICEVQGLTLEEVELMWKTAPGRMPDR